MDFYTNVYPPTADVDADAEGAGEPPAECEQSETSTQVIQRAHNGLASSDAKL